VVLAIDGQSVQEPDDVSQAIASKHPGDKVRVEVEREGRRQTITVTLGTRPDRIP
jgi:S1-C subfamily serine protease